MNKWTVISLVLLAFVSAGFGWYLKPPERIYHTEHQQRQIDSLTTALVNTNATKQSLRDSLKYTSEKFREYIQDHEGEVASLTTIRGRLNIRIDQLEDSLANAFTPIVFDSTGIPDTLIVVRRNFGDGLFEVSSYNEFRNNQFRDSLSMKQLRPIRVDLATLISKDERTVESVVTSKDFDSLYVSAQTTIRPKKRIHWTILVSVGMLLREGINLIF